MNKDQMAQKMQEVFEECGRLRDAGQKEYAHRDENAFANFERVAERLGIDRKKVLMVYMEKHLDGIHSFINGHKSQREDVRGRINDVITYACLLRGMVDEDDGILLPRTSLAITPEYVTVAHVYQESLDAPGVCSLCRQRADDQIHNGSLA
jgi:hypothetical protein